jgi:hypothetical protein
VRSDRRGERRRATAELRHHLDRRSRDVSSDAAPTRVHCSDTTALWVREEDGHTVGGAHRAGERGLPRDDRIRGRRRDRAGRLLAGEHQHLTTMDLAWNVQLGGGDPEQPSDAS